MKFPLSTNLKFVLYYSYELKIVKNFSMLSGGEYFFRYAWMDRYRFSGVVIVIKK
jgi:hypothetical protein